MCEDIMFMHESKPGIPQVLHNKELYVRMMVLP